MNHTLYILKNDPERLITEGQLCDLLEKSTAWAQRLRWSGGGPKYHKIGRSVRYRAGDVLTWIESSSRYSTWEVRHG